MPTYPFMQVDAFTTYPLGGNPCAIVFDADSIDDATKLAIAREMNLSETSFLVSSNKADFGVRYFTPEQEIPLAGHPTIATVFALVESERLILSAERTIITLEMPAGVIPVEIITEGGKIQQIIMTQKPPQFLQIHDPAVVLSLFGLTVDDLVPDSLIQTVSTGTPQLMILVRSLEALRRIDLNIGAYAAYRQQTDFFSAHLFCTQGATPEGQTFARHFVIPPDLIEDPFTGSATGGMAAYLWHYGYLGSPTLIAEQGHWMGRPGQARVEVIGSREHIEFVKVGGAAALILRGELIL